MPSPLLGQPFNCYPRGLYDALDGTFAPDGACFALANLIPDVTTPRVWVPRPAATLLDTASGNITAAIQVGTRIYGMQSIGGVDKPYCYDLSTSAAVPISIPSALPAGAYPTTQATTGAWTPPTMEVVGNRILITHPGYDGTTYFFGWIDVSGLVLVTIGTTAIGNAAITAIGSLAGVQIGDRISGVGIPAGSYVISIDSATQVTINAVATANGAGVAVTFNGGGGASNPLYGAGNTNKNPLPGVPLAVKQLSNRAYYAYKQFAYYSDVLSPCVITNATQFLTLGDTVTTSGNYITGFGQLPLNNQIAGGVVGSLIAFKAINGYWQIKGDIATSDLTLDGPIGGVGCAAPRSIVQTPAGLFFMAADGIRVVDFNGTLQPVPVKAVRQPFVSATTPSRVCAAFNNGVYRVAGYFIYNPVGPNSAFVDYWFDFKLQEWSGPHNSGAGDGMSWDTMVPYADYFVCASNEAAGKLFKSYTYTPVSPAYTENSNTYTIRLQTSQLPQGEGMSVKSVVEGTVDLGFTGAAGPPNYAVSFFNENVLIQGITVNGPTSGNTVLQPYSIAFSEPLVYAKSDCRVSATATGGQRIGAIRLRTEELGYVNTVFPT